MHHSAQTTGQNQTAYATIAAPPAAQPLAASIFERASILYERADVASGQLSEFYSRLGMATPEHATVSASGNIAPIQSGFAQEIDRVLSNLSEALSRIENHVGRLSQVA